MLRLLHNARIGRTPQIGVVGYPSWPQSRRQAFGSRQRRRLRSPAFAHVNQTIYMSMRGPSTLEMSADAKLANWDRVADLQRIEVPTTVIGARYDTVDPAHMERMARLMPTRT